MPIDFRKPHYFKEFRFGSTLVWSVIKEIVIPTVVSGVSPLTLVNAAAKEIRSLIQYGKCTTVNGEIYCNNGKLVAVHRSGLPSGYTLLDSVGGSGSQWVITDIYLASTDVVECEFRNSTTTGFGAVYGIFRLGDSSALYGNQTYYSYDGDNNKVDTGIDVDTAWHASQHDFVHGTLTIDDTTVTFTPFEFENGTNNAVLSRYYNNSYGYGWKGYVRKFKVTRGNEVICDLLPCKNEQDVAGFYDLVEEKFYSPTGGALLEGNVVDDYELAVEGTPEVLSVATNLYDASTNVVGYYIPNSGTPSENPDPTNSYTAAIPVQVGKKYTFTGVSGKAGSNNKRIIAYSSDAKPNASLKVGAHVAVPVDGIGVPYTVSIDLSDPQYANAKYIRFSLNTADTDVVCVEEGSAQTASVINLFAAGDVKDEVDIISGVVTRRTEVSVSGGEITISALAEPVIEQVQEQSLSTAEGINIVAVEAEVNDISLKTEYYTVG